MMFQYPGHELDAFAGAVNWKRYFARRIRPSLAGHVLEIGAGRGATTEALWDGSFASWTCLEPDARFVDALERKRSSWPAAGRVHIRHGTLTAIPCETLYDSIFYIDVLEHIEDDRSEIRAAHSHLAPDGHLIVLAPAHQLLYSPFDRAIGHVRRYSRAALRRLMPSSLHEVRVEALDSVGTLILLANRLLLRQSRVGPRSIRCWDRWVVPVSRWLDPLLGYRVGRSLVGIWQRRTGGGASCK
jgi:SAM-dependent methyltransferase